METTPPVAQGVGRTVRITWPEVMAQLEAVDTDMNARVFGVPRGGMIAAGFLSRARNVWREANATVILDDIEDTGATRKKYAEWYPRRTFHALFNKRDFPTGTWLQMPWETETGPDDAVARLLGAIAPHPLDPGMDDTPRRVVAAFREMTAGYAEDPKAILSQTFEADCDEMVVATGIEFVSLCEHHLMTFTGTATIAYVPDAGRVVGISKLARIVQCFARRLQLQERLTEQIAQSLEIHVGSQGVGVVIEAQHSCMACRGIRQPNARIITSKLTGCFAEDATTRAEFMSLARR